MTVLRLYGVTYADAPPVPDVLGRADAPVRLVHDDAVGVLVSEVDEASRAGRKDLLAHARVLEAYVEATTVVPMQFGLALADEAAVREQLLDRDRDELLRLLRAFDGQVQLTVQAQHAEEWALRTVLGRDPRLAELRRQLAGRDDPAGQVRLGQAVAQPLEELQQEDASLLLDRLSPLARSTAPQRVDRAHQVLDAAFLVDRSGRSAFDEAVAALGEQVGDRIRLRYVGPQPPYAFLDAARTGEHAWA